MAELALAATKFGWQCTHCHQLFDSMWRPIKPEKTWQPPISFNWTIDPPPFNYCPNCGEEFKNNDEPTSELRIG